ncbi:MAG: hypothetical protein ABJI69_03345 [Balneola sp.]
MNTDKKLIDYKIKKRNDTYFLVTESDLNEIKSKSNYLDWAFLFTSIFLGSLVSIIITLSYGVDLNTNAKSILYTLLWVFTVLSLGCLILSVFLHGERKKVIVKIKGKEDISLQIEEYQEKPNPERFKGSNRLGLNIDANQRELFFQAIKNNPVLSSIRSSHHANTQKKDYFTFVLYDVNDELKDYFKKFLDDHSINRIDYDYL